MKPAENSTNVCIAGKGNILTVQEYKNCRIYSERSCSKLMLFTCSEPNSQIPQIFVCNKLWPQN